MSLRSRIARLFSDAPSDAPDATDASGVEQPSRHDRREAGRRRHHATGEPAWQESDRIDQAEKGPENPDAAPEILGG